jgi:predicted Zn finger-like uncharacterized protein
VLITTCAHCKARFRVTPQQLNAKQGQVRCGHCTQVFNGFQSLERFPDDDTGGRLLAEYARKEDPPAASSKPLDEVDLPLFDESPPRAEPQAESSPVTAPDLEVGAEVEVQPPALEHAEVAQADPASTPRTHRHIDPALTLQVDPPAPPARAWRFGATFLAVVLALELGYAYRSPLAQRYPVLRPTLESLCIRVGCAVAWSREESLLKLEDSELLEVPGRPNEIALGARIRNLAQVAQEFPHLELTLTDLGGQAAVRRVLRPTDYLGRPLGYGEVIAPGTEVAIQLRLETPRLKATGYELLVFYP